MNPYKRIISNFIESADITKEQFCVMTGVNYPTLLKAINGNDIALSSNVFDRIFNSVKIEKPKIDIAEVPACIKVYGDFYFCRKDVRMISFYERKILALYTQLNKHNQSLLLYLMMRLAPTDSLIPDPYPPCAVPLRSHYIKMKNQPPPITDLSNKS